MYKYLVVGVTVAIILGAGFYLRSSGGAQLIGEAYAQDTYTNYNPTSIESIPGVYYCLTTTGCLSTSTIVLKDDNTLEMITVSTSSPGELTVNEAGEVVGFEEVTVTEEVIQDETTQNSDNYEIPLNEQSISLLEKGTWDIGRSNILIVALTGTATSSYDVAKKIIVQRVSTSTLSRFSFDKLQYPTFRRPIFLKQHD